MQKIEESTRPCKRSHPRAPVCLSVVWWKEDGRISECPTPSDGRALDISQSGLFVRTPQLPPSGTKLRLLVQPPNGEGLLTISAQVKWASRGHDGGKGTGFGLQFEDGPLSQSIINRMMNTAPSAP